MVHQSSPQPVQAKANESSTEPVVQPTVVPVQEPSPTPTVEPVTSPEPEQVKAEEPAPEVIQTSYHQDKYELMRQAGISPEDYGATDYIVSHESSWDLEATNPSTGAYGLCQSLPASKMASEGSDYLTNPVTQLRWCHRYAQSRYGSWWASFAWWSKNLWW